MKKLSLFVVCSILSPTVLALSSFAGYGVISTQNDVKIAPKACYCTTADKTTGTVGLALDGQNYEDAINLLQFQPGCTKYGPAFTAYFNVLTKNQSLQYNYIQTAGNNSSVYAKGYKLDALNDYGKQVYTTQKDQFDNKCGGYLLIKYLKGSFITAAITINFSTPAEASDYQSKTASSSRALGARIHELNKLAAQYKYKGSVTIQAIQLGGTPDSLALTGLQKNANGYYSLTCDLNGMESCVNSTLNIYNYVAQNYPSQINLSTGQGLAPLLMYFNTMNKRYLGL